MFDIEDEDQVVLFLRKSKVIPLDIQHQIIDEYPKLINEIPWPDQSVILKAIINDPHSIRHFTKRCSLEHAYIAVIQDIEVLSYFDNPDVKLQEYAINKDDSNIRYINNPHPDIVRKVILADFRNIENLKKHHEFPSYIQIILLEVYEMHALNYIRYLEPDTQIFCQKQISKKNWGTAMIISVLLNMLNSDNRMFVHPSFIHSLIPYGTAYQQKMLRNHPSFQSSATLILKEIMK